MYFLHYQNVTKSVAVVIDVIASTNLSELLEGIIKEIFVLLI